MKSSEFITFELEYKPTYATTESANRIISTSQIIIPDTSNVTYSEKTKKDKINKNIQIESPIVMPRHRIGAGVLPIMFVNKKMYVVLILEAECLRLVHLTNKTSKTLIENTSKFKDQNTLNKILNNGLYSSIGGGQEDYEDIYNCALRETNEETYRAIRNVAINKTRYITYMSDMKKQHHTSFIVQIDDEPQALITNYYTNMATYWKIVNYDIPTCRGRKDFTIGISIFPVVEAIQEIKTYRKTNEYGRIKINDYNKVERRISERAEYLILNIDKQIEVC